MLIIIFHFLKVALQRPEIKTNAKEKPNEMPAKIVMQSKKKLTDGQIMRGPTDSADRQVVGR